MPIGAHTVPKSAGFEPRPVAKRRAALLKMGHASKSLVAALRRRFLDQAVGLLASNAAGAAGRILKLGEIADSESVQLRALRAILTDAVAVAEFTTLEERLGYVEERLDERPRTGKRGKCAEAYRLRLTPRAYQIWVGAGLVLERLRTLDREVARLELRGSLRGIGLVRELGLNRVAFGAGRFQPAI